MVLSVVTIEGEADGVRQVLRDLLLEGADFLHFSKEDDTRRARLAKAVGALDLDLMTVVRQGKDTMSRARAVGLTTMAWVCRDRVDLLILESRGAKPDRGDADLLAKARPAGGHIPVRFLGKRDDPMLWAADIVASATFQALARGVPEHLEALGQVERVDY
jgi:hypothetical protein